MSDLRVSMTTKQLLAAAKADMPSAAARAKMWAGVSGTVGGAAGAASGGTTTVVLGGGASTGKLLAMTGLFGGTLAVGLAAALLKIGAATPPLPQAAVTAPAVVWATTTTPTRESIPPSIAGAFSTPTVAPTSGRMGPPARVAKPRVHEGALAREASLVAQARNALGQRDPRSALRAIREARSLSSHQLVPEELAVEEQALRALGQSDEANGIDVQLRLQYPESALAR
ncbi:MAG: hypothetical protein M3O46_15515 [Myxococcota bacterium]|nr:hypothetical protein [Myxococcota bacterium]